MTLSCSFHADFASECISVHIIQMGPVGRQMFQHPVLTPVDDPGVGDKLFPDLCSLPVEVQVFHSPVDVNGPRLSVQVRPQPIVHFKCKDVGGGADFQYQVVRA